MFLPYLHCFFSPLLLYSSIFSLSSPSLFLVISDPSGLSVAKSSFSLPPPPPPPPLVPKQFNQSLSLFRVRPIGLSPAEAFLLFALELAAIPAGISWLVVTLDKRKFE